MNRPTALTEFLRLPKQKTLFEQVSHAIGQLICDGRWRPGELLPNEIELAAEFGVSQGTMRRALKMLVDMGVLTRHQGRGTFVADFSGNEQKVYERYIRLLPDTPEEESGPSSTVLVTFEHIGADSLIAKKLSVAPQTPVIHAVRLLNTRRGTVTYDELWALESVFTRVTAENLLKHKERMLYAFYQKQCGVTITRCEEDLKAVLVSDEVCARCQFTPPMPAIEISRLSYTYDDRPVEYHRQYAITTHHHYHIG